MEANAQTFWLENLKTASNYNSWIFSQIQPWLGNDVLEVGCGNGNFSEFLAHHCQRLVAVDLDETYVNLTQQRLRSYDHVEVLQADATKLQGQEHFDTIIMLDVLEHIEDDVATLKQLSHCLKPGGKFVVKVPALSSLYTPMDEVIGHYRRYQKDTLQATFERAGFTKPHLWYFNVGGIPGWWLNGKVLKRTTPASNQIGLFDKVVPLLKTVESIVKPPVGLSLFAIASK